eukprot:12598560-Alexandrium_andersonii.AAC.1
MDAQPSRSLRKRCVASKQVRRLEALAGKVSRLLACGQRTWSQAMLCEVAAVLRDGDDAFFKA